MFILKCYEFKIIVANITIMNETFITSNISQE